jgi:hypothetical protein
MTVNGKGLATTWGECRALGLTLLGDAAWEIAVGDATAPSPSTALARQAGHDARLAARGREPTAPPVKPR